MVAGLTLDLDLGFAVIGTFSLIAAFTTALRTTFSWPDPNYEAISSSAKFAPDTTSYSPLPVAGLPPEENAID